MKKDVLSVGMVCPECGSDVLVADPAIGEVSCPSCGYVVVERDLDRRPEWTKDEKEVNRMKAGPPLSIMLHDYGLSTSIDQVNIDAMGRRLPKDVRHNLFRLKRLDSISVTDKAEANNLQQAAYILQVYIDRLRLPKPIAEEAMAIYRKALKKGLVKGRSIRSIVAGSLYAACRIMGIPRNLKEFERAYPMVRRRTVAQAYRLLMKNLGIKPPLQDPSIFIIKIASRLGLCQKTVQEALRIIDEARKKGLLVGKDPVGVAAAALYIGCEGREARQKDIANAAGITEVTVRHRSKELRNILY